MLILIIDSSIQIIERLEEMISEAKNITAIHSAVSYEEAKKLFEKNKYDMVLLDIDLPGNGSLKLLNEIEKTIREACIILLFTQMNSSLWRQYRSLGIDFFFDKYYDFEKIGETIDYIGQFTGQRD